MGSWLRELFSNTNCLLFFGVRAGAQYHFVLFPKQEGPR